jgi:hypothetical protein
MAMQLANLDIDVQRTLAVAMDLGGFSKNFTAGSNPCPLFPRKRTLRARVRPDVCLLVQHEFPSHDARGMTRRGITEPDSTRRRRIGRAPNLFRRK